MQRWQERPAVVAAWGMLAAFGTYACMYGFRKPFAAGSWEGAEFGPGLKASLVTAQTLGYALSKWIGIGFVSGLAPARRVGALLALVGMAEVALVMAGLLPRPWNIACLFLNGLPLGMVFGLVLGFLEGRRMTEALVAGLCASFILADGFAKSVGAQLLAMGVAERWMPATAGLLFAPPLVGFAWLLKSMPPPTAADVAARQARTPMDAGQRRVFLRRNGWVVGWVVAAYAMITVLRGLRADFAPELWTALGYPGQPSVFTRSEVWVALGVLMANAVAVRWHDNTAAFRYGLGISLGGVALVMGALAGRTWGDLEGFLFMVLLGLGLYLPYVAVHTTLLERLVARAEDRANLGFVMYLADAGGYVAYAAVLLLRGRGTGATVSLGAFSTLTWWLAGVAALAFGMVGWLMRTSATREPRPE
ncbi:MAG: DUF5690 family protein [Verrucomicrobiota bacterium]|jgi:hypothetical protein